jgi:hypothetical protein
MTTNNNIEQKERETREQQQEYAQCASTKQIRGMYI